MCTYTDICILCVYIDINTLKHLFDQPKGILPLASASISGCSRVSRVFLLSSRHLSYRTQTLMASPMMPPIHNCSNPTPSKSPKSKCSSLSSKGLAPKRCIRVRFRSPTNTKAGGAGRRAGSSVSVFESRVFTFPPLSPSCLLQHAFQ